MGASDLLYRLTARWLDDRGGALANRLLGQVGSRHLTP
jgi:hypothetical protein